MRTTIQIPTYECKITFEVVPTNKDVCLKTNSICKRFKKPQEAKEGDISWGECYSPDINNYFMIISKESLKDYNFNTFFHELFHIIDMVTSDRDIEDGEAKAYLQGHIGQSFIKKLLNYLKT